MSIVSGAVAGRMKLLPFFIFAIVLTGFIYPIQGYWNWGGGFLSSGGYSDYAGSGTVHLCGAAAALAVVTVLGARKGKYNYDGTSNAMPGSNIPMAALGAWILWLGWFGFNGGSELKVSEVSSATAVSQVFLNTNMAAAGGVLAALFMSLFMTGKMDVTMAINGAIAGLVSITADPLSPAGGTAVIVGAIGGAIVYASIVFLEKAGVVLKIEKEIDEKSLLKELFSDEKAETTTIDDLKEKSKKELEELLKIAVQNENYESAAKIRDEISNR